MKLETQTPDPQLTLVHHADPRGVWATRGRGIHHAPGSRGPWTRIGSFPIEVPVDLGMGRVARRLLRSDKCNVYPTRSGRLLGIRQGVVYRFEGENAVPLFSIQGDCIMNRSIAEDAEGNLFFGEYFGNGNRGPVHIWRVAPDLESFEVAYTLPAGCTRHVHAVHVDPFDEGRLWVTMGDFAGECFLAYTDDGFRSLEFLGDGSQLWRMVGIVFQENRLCWLTDSHIEQNHVVSMDRSRKEAVIHGKRDSSTWFVAESTEGLYLATTCVEAGAGIQTSQVRLLVSDDGIDWEPVLSLEKDRLPMKLGFGSLALPSGVYSKNGFWISGEAVVGMDGRSQLCQIL